MKNPLKSIKERRAQKPERPRAHRLPANVTEEEDWEVEVPQIRMSRAFGVMLALHLVAVGGLFAFHMFGKDDHENERAGTALANATAAPPQAPDRREAARTSGAVAVATPGAAGREIIAPRVEIMGEGESDTLVEHTVANGETRGLIAARYGVTVSELEGANRDVNFLPGVQLIIPSHKRLISALPEESRTAASDTAVLEASRADIPRRIFATKEEQETTAPPVSAVAENASRPLLAAPVRETSTREVASNGSREPAVAVDPPRREPKPEPAPEPPRTAGSRSHVVQKGDTVYNIARRYSLSPGDVLKANGLTADAKIQLGQVLKIPVRR